MRIPALLTAALLFGCVWPNSLAAQGSFFFNTDSTTGGFVLAIVDTNGNLMYNQPLSLSISPDLTTGGHNHVGSFVPRLARLDRTTCTTGFDARQCVLAVSTDAAGGTARLTATITSGSNAGFSRTLDFNVSAFGGFDMGTRLEDYQNGSFALIGQRDWHRDNHYCEQFICERAVNLAVQYRDTWSLILAYNDISLIKGGVFDVNQNWIPPHHEHRNARQIDVRANGGENSIPRDNETIREWFRMKVNEIFGQPAAHEDAGTDNEHFHLRG